MLFWALLSAQPSEADKAQLKQVLMYLSEHDPEIEAELEALDKMEHLDAPDVRTIEQKSPRTRDTSQPEIL